MKCFEKTAWPPDSKTILAQVFVDKDTAEENIGIKLFLISVDETKVEKNRNSRVEQGISCLVK